MTVKDFENFQETSVHVPNEALEKSQIPRIISIPLIAEPSFHKPHIERVRERRRRKGGGGIFDKIFSRPPRTKKTKKPKASSLKPKIPSFVTDTEAPDLATAQPPPPPKSKTKPKHRSKPTHKPTRRPKATSKPTPKPLSKPIPEQETLSTLEPTPPDKLTPLSPTEAPEIPTNEIRTSFSSGEFPNISTALIVVTEEHPMNLVGSTKPVKHKKKSKQINFGSIVLVICGAAIAFLLSVILVLLCRIRLVMIAEKKSEVELAMSNSNG